MGYLEDKLTENESILHSTKPHWFTLMSPLISGIFLIPLVIATKYFNVFAQLGLPNQFLKYVNMTILALIVFFVIFPLISAQLKRSSTKIAITNKRIIYKQGLFNIDLQGMPIPKIENNDSRQSFLGRVFGYGDVEVKGSGSTPIYFHCISDPMAFRRALANQIDALRHTDKEG